MAHRYQQLKVYEEAEDSLGIIDRVDTITAKEEGEEDESIIFQRTEKIRLSPLEIGRLSARTLLCGTHSFGVNILSYFCLVGGIKLYIATDKECPYSLERDCLEKYINPNMAAWTIQLGLASVGFLSLLILSLIKKIPKRFGFASFSSFIYLCYFYNPNLSSTNYGLGFAIMLHIMVFFEAFLLGLGYFVWMGMKKMPKVTFLILFLCFTLGIIWHQAMAVHSCDDWSRGLDGERISSPDGTCQIQEPSFCIYEISSGWFDFSSGSVCDSAARRKEVNQELLKLFYPPGNLIAFPRSEKFKRRNWDIQQEIIKNVVAIDSLEHKRAKDLEIFLNKTSPKTPHFIIDVKRNEGLINERRQSTAESLAPNVLAIYVDALSRANSIRKLNKTMSWFEKFMNQKDPSKETFQFFKYHSVAGYTDPNLWQLYHGVDASDTNFQSDHRVSSIVDTFKKNGYITGLASDLCSADLFIYPNDVIIETPFDHEGLTFACDPHYSKPWNRFGQFYGPYASVRRCLYGKDTHEYVLEYGDQFWRKYADEKKYLRLTFIDSHEITGEVIKYSDDHIYMFLNNLEKDGLLENTIIMLYSDHGLHMLNLWQILRFQQFYIERHLPTFYLILPGNLAQEYGKIVKANQQRLVYSRDFHHFLKAIPEGKNSEHFSKSILSNLPSDRTCHDLRIDREIDYCSCDSQK